MRGYLVHEYYSDDNEDASDSIGTVTRTHLFPFLHIALSCGLHPVISRRETTSKQEVDDIDSFLSLQDEKFLPTSNVRQVVINTTEAHGDPNLVAQKIFDDYFEHYKDDTTRLMVVRLHGSLRAMEPTPVVYQWLQERSSKWRLEDDTAIKTSTATLRIAAHVRVPAEVNKLVTALEKLNEVGLKVEDCELNVYVEGNFSLEVELPLTHQYTNARIHRSTSSKALLDGVKAMALADILIPSSNYLSSFVGYLAHGVTVISDPSTWEYFQQHRELRCDLIQVSDLERHSIVPNQKVMAIPSVPLSAGSE